LDSMASWVALLHPHDQERFSDDFADCVERRTAELAGEYRLLGSHEQTLYVAVHGRVAELDHDGKARRTAGTIQNITARVSETKLRDALLNRSAAAILLVDPNRRIIDANAQFTSDFVPPGKTLVQ